MQSTVIDIYVYFLKIGHRRKITFLVVMISDRVVTATSERHAGYYYRGLSYMGGIPTVRVLLTEL